MAPTEILAEQHFNTICQLLSRAGHQEEGEGYLCSYSGILSHPLTVALLIGDIAYDFIHGVRVIERKRDRVRYKYGQTLSLELEPTFNLNNRSVGLKFSYNF